MSSSWTVDPEVLIIEVESRPLLYSKSLAEYANKIMKNNAWEDVTKKLSEDWDSLTNEEKNCRCKDVQAKWKHLRDNFRREYQAQRDVTSGQGAKKRKKYRYYDALLFLIPHVKDAKTSGNYSTPTNTNISEQNTQIPSISHIEDSPAGPSTAAHNVSATPKKKGKPTFEDAILKAIDSEMSMDEDKTFCLSLVQSLKKMDDDNKMLAKIEILNVIRTFLNRTRNTYTSELNQSPYTRTNIEPNFSHPNSNLSVQSTPIYTQTTQQQHSQSGTTLTNLTPHQQYSQLTFTQVRDKYQQHSVSHPTSSLYQTSSVNPVHQSKMIKILENRQYRPANSTAQSSRSHSAQSFFTTYDPDTSICPSPSNTDPLNSTMVQSPFNDISSPEDYYLSPDDCQK